MNTESHLYKGAEQTKVLSKGQEETKMKKEEMIQMKASLIIGVVLLSILAGCIEQQRGIVKPYKEEVQEVFEDALDAGVISLDFETYNGHIEVHFWDSQEYKIEVNKWARAETSAKAKENVEDIQVDISVSGNTLKLKVHYMKDAGADVEAYLPQRSFDTVELSSSNGYIRTEEMTASDVSVATSNGSVEAYITADDIEVETSNSGVKGFFQGETVDIDTSNGQIDIECGDGKEYTVETSNARIVLKAGSRGEFDLSTSNGSIDITVTGDFDFDLETSNGTVQVAASGVTYTLDSKTHKKGSTGTDPEMSITASTSNASITVTKK